MSARTIIFDMDGVITSEEGYWRAAAVTLLELAAQFGNQKAGRLVDNADSLPWAFSFDPEKPAEDDCLQIDRAVIAQLKNRGINTNWDLCFVAAVQLLKQRAKPSGSQDNAFQIGRTTWDHQTPFPHLIWPPNACPNLTNQVDSFLAGASQARDFALLEELTASTEEAGLDPSVFARKGPVWNWCYQHFQNAYLGSVEHRASADFPGGYFLSTAGILAREELLLPADEIRNSLASLRQKGYRLAVATGRTYRELVPLLAKHNLFEFFEPEAIVTDDSVVAAEKTLTEGVHLSKPHPFTFLRALFPEASLQDLARGTQQAPAGTVIVGDTVGDISAAKQIGATAIAVATGAQGRAGAPALEAAGADQLISDVRVLPFVPGI